MTRQQRFFGSLRIAFIITGIIFLLWASNLFEQTRLRFNNVFYTSRPTQGSIVIIAADDASFEAYGRSMTEWSRSLHADLIRVLNEAGARVIGFDVLFAQSAEGDEVFADAMIAARNSRTATATILPIVGTNNLRFEDRALNANSILEPTSELLEAAQAVGFANAIPDVDGVVRWQPLKLRVEEDEWLSFSIAVYLSYLSIPSQLFPQFAIFKDETVELTSARQIPVDVDNRVMTNFFGSPNTFPVYSYQDVLERRVDLSVFDDKIVLVGVMNSTGQTDNYLVPTSFNGQQMAGVEIHANIIETLLQDVPLRSQSTSSQTAMIVSLVLLASLIYGQLPHQRLWLWLVLSTLALIVVWFVVAANIFSAERLVLNLFYALIAIVLPAPAILAQQSAFETRRRHRMELLLDSIMRAADKNLSLGETLKSVSGDFKRIVECETVEIWLKDDEGVLTRAYPMLDNPPSPISTTSVAAKDSLHHAEKILSLPMQWQGKAIGVFIAYPVYRLQNRDIFERFTSQTASMIANARLFEETTTLSDLKTRMIRMASHDLKNPLGAIIGYIELIEMDMIGEDVNSQILPDYAIEYINNMKNAAKRMKTIVDDILQLERTRSGKLDLAPIRLTDLIKDTVEIYLPQAAQKRQTFTIRIPDVELIVVGDEPQLKEAFSNLIGNAIKYTPNEGKIKVCLKAAEAMVRFWVEDTGYGISEEGIKGLFQEFYRVRTSETAHIQGTGLGLSLVKAVIDAHKGRIWVESVEGKGSTFFVELPLNRDILAHV